MIDLRVAYVSLALSRSEPSGAQDVYVMPRTDQALRGRVKPMSGFVGKSHKA